MDTVDMRDKYEFQDAAEETLAAFHVRTGWSDLAEWYSITVGGNDAEVYPIAALPGDRANLEYLIRCNMYNERVDWTMGDVMITVAVVEVATGMYYYLRHETHAGMVDWEHPRPFGMEA